MVLFKRCHSANAADLPCSRPSRRWLLLRDRRCPRRQHSCRADHPEPDAAAATAAVAAPGRLRQPPGSGGWAPGTEKLPPHPSPSSHSLEDKTKAERRFDSGAGGGSAAGGTHGSPRRRRLPRALPPASLRPRAPQLRSPLGSGTGGAGPGSASSGWPRVLGAVAFRSPRQSR